MAFIRNTDKLIEGSSQLFFTNQRAKSAVQSDLDTLSLSISSEQSSRQSADSAMALRLNILEGNSSVSGSVAKAQKDAQDYADAKIAALVNSAPSVLDTLKELSDALGGDANFAATVAGQIGSVDNKVNQEVLDRAAAISAMNLRVLALEADPVTKSYVDGQISAEQSARSSAISNEQSARQAADSALSSRIESLEADPVTKTYVDGQVSSLDGRLDALESDDTTKTYVDGLASAFDARLDILEADPTTKMYVDGEVSDLQGQITQEISNRQSAVSAEESRAMAAEGLLDGRLDTLEQDPTTKSYVDGEVSGLQSQISQEISDRQGAISTEQSARAAGDNALDARLDILEQDPVTKTYVDGEVSELSTQLSSEMSAMDSRLDILEQDPVTKMYVDGEVSDLQGQITQEISDRQGAISSEQSARQSADSALDARLDILELDPTTKTYVDGIQFALDGRLDILESDPVTKAYVDSEVLDLQGQINNVLSNVDPAAIDSLSEVVAAFEAADSSINGAISSLSSGLDARLDVLEQDPTTKSYVDAEMSAEESARMSADNALDGRLDVLELDPVTKSYVDSEMGSEESARIAADQALDGRLDILEADPVTKTYVNGLDMAMDSRVDALELDVVKKTYVDNQISSANSARISADNALSSRLSILEADPTTKTYVDGIKSALDAEDLTLFKKNGSRAMTGQFLAAAGTAGAPSISFDGYTNLGIFQAAGTSLGFVIGGVTKASVNAGGMAVTGALSASGSVTSPSLVSSGGLTMSAASLANMVWTTDGSGNIGASGANRPNNVYVKTDVVAGSRVYSNQSTASAPTFTFSGAATYGMYFDTSVVGISAGGSAIATFSSSYVQMNKNVGFTGGIAFSRLAVASDVTIAGNTIYGVTNCVSGRILTLPAAGSNSNRVVYVKDETGTASVSNYIRILAPAGALIEGQQYYDIVVPYESVQVYCNGTNWFII